ncbi:MAG: hypothetical protein JWP13_865 [Candidatus Saccharibacteria bacterium]|nr:hypothetical protein [Candidatus Saccharibacteria bacterium]
MVTLATVDEQLKAIGCNFRFWGRAELRELCEILLPGETIAQAVNGQYEGGFALLCATDFRVLLIDKKPKYLTLKDIRFDMITELDFAGRMMNSTVRIYTPNKELRFTTPSNKRLRKLYTYTQHKVMEIRNHFMIQQFQQQHEIKNTPPGIIMSQQYNQQLPAENYQSLPAGPPPIQSFTPAQNVQTNLYNPEPSEEHRRLAAAMGNAGLRSIVHNGQVIKEYMVVPFAQRWRKRPYGFSHDSLPVASRQTQ